ncbi:MAG: hypothetical protein WC891_02215 [Actinomycetota bacterium]
MKTASRIALGLFITVLIIVAVAGVGGSVYLYSSYKSMKADKAKAEADVKKAQSEREALKIELDDVKEKLAGKKDGTSGPVTRHPLTGMTPVDIVKLALTLKGEDVTKFAVKQNSNDGSKAEVWIGPLNSEFGKAYDFAKQDGEWILYDIRNLGT